METFSRGQQVVVLLIIFGMALLYFHSINQPISRQHVGRAVPANSRWAQPTLPTTQYDRESVRPEFVEGRFSGAQLLTLNKPINLNTASKTDLEAVPGIGPKTAEKIIDYRKEHGRFRRIEDIMNVEGIKSKRFEKMKKYLTVK